MDLIRNLALELGLLMPARIYTAPWREQMVYSARALNGLSVVGMAVLLIDIVQGRDRGTPTGLLAIVIIQLIAWCLRILAEPPGQDRS